MLYGLLASRFPSIGVLVAQAASMVEAGEHRQALKVLERLVPAEVCSFLPYWVTLASAQSAAGQLTLAPKPYRPRSG